MPTLDRFGMRWSKGAKRLRLAIWLLVTVAAATAIPATAQDQSTSAKVNALLGAHEDLASPAEWRSLGDAAIPILESFVADYNSLPTRRARALDGLAALSSGSTTMQRVANTDREPLIVRMSAVRGLGQILPESDLIPALRPLLNDPQWQMRGATAQALSNTPAGCAEIAVMAQRETAEWRSRFVRNCVDPGNSANQPPVGGGKTVVDSSTRVVTYKIVDPSGTIIFNYASPTNIAKIFPPNLGDFSVLLPNSPTVPFASGPWTFNLLASKPTTAEVQALIKTAPTPTLTTGKLNANLFFVGVPGLDARSAPTDPNFQTILSKVQNIYAQIGVQLGDLTYIDITGPDAVKFTDVQEQDIGALFMLSNDRKARDGAINIFLVDSITGGALSGFIILGESAGIPGTPIRGTPGSGLAVTMADFPSNLDLIANTIAHETGHWLGLFHTTELNGLAFDPLPDTPQCPQVPYDTDHDGIMQPQECASLDATNLMFWTDPLQGPLPTLLTPNQQFVILRNPVVSQPLQSGVQVSSISLGSVPVFTDRLSSPITVPVPHGAVSLDFVGVAVTKFTPTPPTPPTPPATVRVPQDFPTIQAAVNNANPRDTIQVGPGRWCGARITKTLDLIGQAGATIMGCPPGDPGPVGSVRKRGFYIEAAAAGTSIRNFVFDGNGASLGGNPLFYGIEAFPGADNLVIESNTFQGTALGISLADGNNYQVTHNVFDGFTVVSDGEGGVAILMFGDTGQFKSSSILYNQITSTVPAGDFSFASWTNEVDVPLAGIVVMGQDGTIISNNKISITANAHGDGGAGIIATDNFTGFTTTNLTITNNDGRGSAYDLIITKDLSGGTGNSVGAQIRGNFGVNLINGATANVTNRSRKTVLVCDPVTGGCP
jgi:hypothetical protein